VGIWRRRLQNPEECYVMRLKKTTDGEKKTDPDRLTLYDNIIIIISSTHRFMFPDICLSYNTKRSLRAPETAKWSTMAAGPNKASLLRGTLPQCP